MDCRKFHKNLEDYLDDGLDFPGRFGMERHAQQCIRCGKVIADAQRLRHIARQMERVKAPANFESRVLAEIVKDKKLGRFSALQRLWIYGFDFPSARKLAFASSIFAVLAAGIFYLYPFLAGFNRLSPAPAPAPSVIAEKPAIFERKVEKIPSEKLPPMMATAEVIQPSRPVIAELSKASTKEKEFEPPDPEMEQMVDREVGEMDYIEFQVPGPDNRPVSVRWPNKPRNAGYGQTHEEYFIRNVSH